MNHIAFITYKALTSSSPDDDILYNACKKAHIQVTVAPWDDPHMNWAQFDTIILRSCWNYYEHYQNFVQWLRTIDHLHIPIFNPIKTLLWNADKHYLINLQKQGIATIPTRWYKKNTHLSLSHLARQSGWSDIVIKPCIGARAHGVTRIQNMRSIFSQWKLNAIMKRMDIMIQPYMPDITSRGEYSFIFINGIFSHAICKMPQKGQFISNSIGSTITVFHPSNTLIQRAKEVVSLAPTKTLYARVDGLETDNGFFLMELECIEPMLYFERFPQGATQFVSSLKKAGAMV